MNVADSKDSQKKESAMKNERLVIGLLIVFAIAVFVLRLPTIENRSVGSNESTTLLNMAGQAHPDYPTEILKPIEAAARIFEPLTDFKTIVTELETADGHPPIYYWSLLAWNHLVGDGLANSRLLSAVFGSIFLLLIGLALRNQMPLPELILFEVMVGFSSALAYFATEARSYMLCLLLVLLAFALGLRVSRKIREVQSAIWAMALVGLATGLGIFTNYFIVLVAFAIGLWLLLEARRLSLNEIARLAAVFAVPNILFCLASKHFYDLQHEIHASNRNGYKGLLSDLVNFGKHVLRPFVNRVDAGYIPFLAAFVIVILVVALTQKKTKTQKSILTFSLMSFGFVAGGLFIVDALMNKYMYPFRYFVLAVPGLFLLTAVALATEKARWLRVSLNLLVLLVVGLEISNFNWGGTEIAAIDYSKSQTRTATNKLLKLSQFDGKVLVLVERTPERDWPAGIIGDLARKSKNQSAEAGQELEVIVIPKDETAAGYLEKHPEFSMYDKIWYLASDDISLPAREAYEAHQPVQFKIAERHEWGFLLIPTTKSRAEVRN